MLFWETHSPRKSQARIEYIDAFDARGMRRVYGRGDHFGRKAALKMDIWRDKRGQLFARFWSRNSEVDELSIAIHGIRTDSIPKPHKGAAFSDVWIPKVVRDEYTDWMTSEL